MKWLATFVLAFLVFAGANAQAIDPPGQQPPRRQDDVTEPAASVRATPPAPGASAPSGLWLLAFTDDAVWFADPARVSRRGAIVRAWITMVYRVPSSNGVKYATALTEFDCQGQMFRDMAGAFYTASGGVVGQIREAAAEYAIPGSVNASLLETSCVDASHWSSSAVAVPAGLTAVQAADSWFSRQPRPSFTSSSFVGRWENDGDCNKATEFFSNGTIAEPGFTGVWSYAGELLTIRTSDGRQLTLIIEPIDSQQFRYSAPNETSVLMRRCY